MVNKKFYNTVLSLTFSPCRIYLIVGDIYGQISAFNLYKVMNPDLSTIKEDATPKNQFTVQEDVQINSLLTTDNYLIVGVVGEIYGYDWTGIITNKDARMSWKISLPNQKDIFEKAEINCMLVNKKSELLCIGCGDNNIYVIDVEGARIVRTLNAHTDYIHSIFNVGTDLVSGGEDGVVNIWDVRTKMVTNKLEPYKNDDIARPELGKWIGAVCIKDDWLLCGGGPKLSLWHYRSFTPSTIFPIDDQGIHVTNVVDDKVLAGGRADCFYNMLFNGNVVSKIPTSCVTVYTAVHQDDPCQALCIGGSSPKIDVCSNFTYKDQVLTLC